MRASLLLLVVGPPATALPPLSVSFRSWLSPPPCEGRGCDLADHDVACPKGCSGRGTCVRGEGSLVASVHCVCEAGFAGQGCEFVRCPSACSGHGRCDVSGACVCDRGFTGPGCERAEEACPHNCNGRGECDGEKCVCDVGYGGRDCGRAVSGACPRQCSGHGMCSGGKCACDPGFAGAGCEQIVPSPGCPAHCSGRGSCVGGSCICRRGFAGLACERVAPQPRCTFNCSGHGECVGGRACHCHPGWSGAACDRFSAATSAHCAANCSGHGVCLHGACACDAGFVGVECATVRDDFCPHECSGRGRCLAGSLQLGPLPGVVPHLRGLAAVSSDPDHTLASLVGPAYNSGLCVCLQGTGGPGCEDASGGEDRCPFACSGHGFCTEAGCACEAGFGGEDCGVACPGRCSGHGRCTEDGTCACDRHWWGTRCEHYSECPSACSGRGVCQALDGGGPSRCFCAPGWGGAADCSVRSVDCPLDCSGHGTCVNGTCACRHGWRGSLCGTSDADARGARLQQQHAWRVALADRPCPANCSMHGVCLHGSCYCERGRGGPSCADVEPVRERCPNECSRRGACVDGVCMCDSGWQGASCAVEVQTLSVELEAAATAARRPRSPIRETAAVWPWHMLRRPSRTGSA